MEDAEREKRALLLVGGEEAGGLRSRIGSMVVYSNTSNGQSRVGEGLCRIECRIREGRWTCWSRLKSALPWGWYPRCLLMVKRSAKRMILHKGTFEA
jgi:hypothetical protein